MIRLATPDDDVELGELQVAAFKHQFARKLPLVVMPPTRLAELRNQASKREHGTIFVCEYDGQIAGTVGLFRYGVPHSEAWLEGAATVRSLAVAASFHGRGLSHELMGEAERLARDWEVPAICVHVRRECEGVARLYLSRGYLRDACGDRDRRPEVFLEGYTLQL